MADLVVRGIDAELKVRMRLSALREKKSTKQWLQEAIREKLAESAVRVAEAEASRGESGWLQRFVDRLRPSSGGSHVQN